MKKGVISQVTVIIASFLIGSFITMLGLNFVSEGVQETGNCQRFIGFPIHIIKETDVSCRTETQCYKSPLSDEVCMTPIGYMLPEREVNFLGIFIDILFWSTLSYIGISFITKLIRNNRNTVKQVITLRGLISSRVAVSLFAISLIWAIVIFYLINSSLLE